MLHHLASSLLQLELKFLSRRRTLPGTTSLLLPNLRNDKNSDPSAAMESPQIEFCTLGMFIIDEIHFPAPKPPAMNVLGGAGSYSVLGARLFSEPPLSKAVGWIVDCGSDFPDELRAAINNWQTSCLMRDTPDRLTTRAWNKYGENDFRAFRYLTPKLRLDADSLSPQLLRARCFHLICSPSRLISITNKLRDRLHSECGNTAKEPIIIWEPVPDSCTPEELENCRSALKLVDLVSPNHKELSSFFGTSGEAQGSVDRDGIIQHSAMFLHSGIGSTGEGAIVVRCGKDGCYLATKKKSKWLPAYHQHGSEKVVDPTGGGNTFLGGLGIALARGKGVEEASIWGSVAASFAIEQIGVPVRSVHPDGEKWNGVGVRERLDQFLDGLR